MSPILFFALMLGAAVSGPGPLVSPRPSSACDMAEALATIPTGSEDVLGLDGALGKVVGRKYSDPDVEALGSHLKRLPDPPWDQARMGDIAAMRQSAMMLASGQIT